jgi:hypothetical protein
VTVPLVIEINSRGFCKHVQGIEESYWGRGKVVPDVTDSIIIDCKTVAGLDWVRLSAKPPDSVRKKETFFFDRG